MLKRTFVVILGLMALMLPVVAQETTSEGSIFVTGGAINIDNDSITIEGLSNAVPAFVIVDGVPVPSYFRTDLFANGWASKADLTASAVLQVETGTDTDFQFLNVPVTLTAPQYDNGGSQDDASDDVLTFTVSYDLAAATAAAGDGSEPTGGVKIGDLQDGNAFTIIINYTAEYAAELQEGIADVIADGRLTTSRPCSPRSAC